jgi:hypothetical protein
VRLWVAVWQEGRLKNYRFSWTLHDQIAVSHGLREAGFTVLSEREIEVPTESRELMTDFLNRFEGHVAALDELV